MNFPEWLIFLEQDVTDATARKLNTIRLLRSWRDADDTEHKETWEYLRRVLDEDRSSERKLFP